ncbi:protocadherin alpha-C2-like isoform X1 [Paramormyrops kingsleyae]|uniref:protocadherin alpha-C2-like isoform X1 n=1 Tax=Paramormyrops kingsleyae TaxID=1676925 RepID=UPI003B976C4A
MNQRISGRWMLRLLMLTLGLSLGVLDSALVQIRYTVPEEQERGAFVGNITEDLGLEIAVLSLRRFRIVSSIKKQYLAVNLQNGILFVIEKIDRDEMCEQNPTCFFYLQVVIENPFELYRIEVEVLDVNDNAPRFPQSELSLEISESSLTGSRFPLDSAQDMDVGVNSLNTYLLSVNQHFALEMLTRSDGTKFVELVLDSPLDREKQTTHQMVLTAVDSGTPEKSGTIQIIVFVLDANDNVPVFDRSVYRVKLFENSPQGTTVIKLNASDMDEGSNADISYSFSGHSPLKVRDLFEMDSSTGEIRVKGVLDYEKAKTYEIYVQAKDRGPSAVAVYCTVLVDVLDVNDNRPDVFLTSVSMTIPEDASPGTVIAVISVMDRDSGENGNVICHIPRNTPFELLSSYKNYYTLITSDFLDREIVAEYNITFSARDLGTPSLSTTTRISIQVSDINDNAPVFARQAYTVYVTENNVPGASIFSVTAVDPDWDYNACLSYFILGGQIQDIPVSIYISINSANGDIYALRSFDYEKFRKFQFQVQVQDAGLPPLSSNIMVNVFVLDQNDNAPIIISPLPTNGSFATETVPRSADAGYLVGKIIATDADAGQNSRLSHQLIQATDPTLFSLALYTGEIRTIRRLTDKDARRQRLIISVKDNGQPALSATISIIVSVVDSVPESLSDLDDLYVAPPRAASLILYMIVSCGAFSLVLLVAIIVLNSIKGYWIRHSTESRDSIWGLCCGVGSGDSNENVIKSNPHERVSARTTTSAGFGELKSSCAHTHASCLQVCLTPGSVSSDFMFLKAGSLTQIKNNAKGDDCPELGWKTFNKGTESPYKFKQLNMDCTLSSNQQNIILKSSVGIDRTIVQKEPGIFVDQITNHCWTWGTQLHADPVTGALSSTQAQRLEARYVSHMLPDYQHNVYIPGTTHSDLHVHSSFSTFGKKTAITSNFEAKGASVIVLNK